MPLPIAVILLFSLITFVTVLVPIRTAVYLMKEDSKKRVLYSPNYPQWYISTPKWVIKYIWPADPGVVNTVIGPIGAIIVFLIGYKYTVVIAVCHMYTVIFFEIVNLILDKIMWKQAKKHKTLD